MLHNPMTLEITQFVRLNFMVRTFDNILHLDYPMNTNVSKHTRQTKFVSHAIKQLVVL